MGERIRRRRLELGLRQRDVAERIKCSATAIYNWEQERTSPKVSQLPAIIGFLAYAPWSAPKGFGAWLRQVREGLGLSRRKLARRLNVDESTIAGWERLKRRPTAASLEKMQMLLDRL